MRNLIMQMWQFFLPFSLHPELPRRAEQLIQQWVASENGWSVDYKDGRVIGWTAGGVLDLGLSFSGPENFQDDETLKMAFRFFFLDGSFPCSVL